MMTLDRPPQRTLRKNLLLVVLSFAVAAIGVLPNWNGLMEILRGSIRLKSELHWGKVRVGESLINALQRMGVKLTQERRIDSWSTVLEVQQLTITNIGPHDIGIADFDPKRKWGVQFEGTFDRMRIIDLTYEANNQRLQEAIRPSWISTNKIDFEPVLWKRGESVTITAALLHDSVSQHPLQTIMVPFGDIRGENVPRPLLRDLIEANMAVAYTDQDLVFGVSPKTHFLRALFYLSFVVAPILSLILIAGTWLRSLVRNRVWPRLRALVWRKFMDRKCTVGERELLKTIGLHYCVRGRDALVEIEALGDTALLETYLETIKFIQDRQSHLRTLSAFPRTREWLWLLNEVYRVNEFNSLFVSLKEAGFVGTRVSLIVGSTGEAIQSPHAVFLSEFSEATVRKAIEEIRSHPWLM